jgi:hypothetical protein
MNRTPPWPATMNYEPADQQNNEGWMVDAHETLLHLVSVPWLTIVVNSSATTLSTYTSGLLALTYMQSSNYLRMN